MPDSPGSVRTGGILLICSNKWLLGASSQWDKQHKNIHAYLRTHILQKEAKTMKQYQSIEASFIISMEKKINCDVQVLVTSNSFQS